MDRLVCRGKDNSQCGLPRRWSLQLNEVKIYWRSGGVKEEAAIISHSFTTPDAERTYSVDEYESNKNFHRRVHLRRCRLSRCQSLERAKGGA